SKQLRNIIVEKNELIQQLKTQIQQRFVLALYMYIYIYYNNTHVQGLLRPFQKKKTCFNKIGRKNRRSSKRTIKLTIPKINYDLDNPQATSFSSSMKPDGRSKEFSTAATSTVKMAVMVLTFVVGWIAIALVAGERSLIDMTKVDTLFDILPAQAKLDVNTFSTALNYFSEHELELVLKHEKIDSVIRPLQQQIMMLTSKLESTDSKIKQWQHDYGELDKQRTSLVLKHKEAETHAQTVQLQATVLENELALLKAQKTSELNRNDTYCICNPGHSEVSFFFFYSSLSLYKYIYIYKKKKTHTHTQKCSPMEAIGSTWLSFF
ncbi:hypothetical protein RFI_01585, partial [Reticulomyxa filosa]